MKSKNPPAIHVVILKLAEKLANLYPSFDEQQQVAWWMLQGITGKSQAELLAADKILLSEEQEKKLALWLDQHVNEKKPLQYILGNVPFNDVIIKVRPPILIPRPETEEWVMNLVAQLKQLKNQSLDILDIGTGSGAIAIACAKGLKKSRIYATDINNDALVLAQENANVNNVSSITFIHSDVFNSIPKNLKFDLIISNPPYISDAEWAVVDPMVKEWEDKRALVAHENGLEIIKKIINQAPEYLNYNNELVNRGIGQLYIEIGYAQADAVRTLMQQVGYGAIRVLKDLEGKNRVVVGRLQHELSVE